MTTFKEYEQYDLVGLGELIRRRELSAREIVQAAIDRITADNPVINAVTHERFDKALAESAAASASSASGTDATSRVDRFGGAPFLLKDSGIQFKGEQTSNASRYWADHIASHDATLTERYRAAGLTVLGFTNTAELGLAPETAPDAYGPTRNPWDLSRSVGGSSGGSAAAVAASFVPAAHATDGGGSIRIPASNAGLFGLKPTRGRNPFGPDAGEGWNGLSTAHAITRSVRDSAALLDATHGPAPGDPYAAPAFSGRYLDIIQRDPAPLRIGFQTVDHEGRSVDAGVVRAVEDAARKLQALGHHVEAASPAVDGRAMRDGTRIIVAANVANVLTQRAQVIGRAATPNDVEPITWRWLHEGGRYTSVDLARAVGLIHRIGRQLGTFFQRYDILLTPTFASPPLPLRTVDMQSQDLDGFYETLRRYSAFTSIYNCAGTPAASLPLFWESGLPIGVQIAAAAGRDDLILQLAAQLERAHPWAAKRPSRPQQAKWQE